LWGRKSFAVRSADDLDEQFILACEGRIFNVGD
jgi:hypothetical protein